MFRVAARMQKSVASDFQMTVRIKGVEKQAMVINRMAHGDHAKGGHRSNCVLAGGPGVRWRRVSRERRECEEVIICLSPNVENADVK
jgi:hypothetical protein